MTIVSNCDICVLATNKLTVDENKKEVTVKGIPLSSIRFLKLNVSAWLILNLVNSVTVIPFLFSTTVNRAVEILAGRYESDDC